MCQAMLMSWYLGWTSGKAWKILKDLERRSDLEVSTNHVLLSRANQVGGFDSRLNPLEWPRFFAASEQRDPVLRVSSSNVVNPEINHPQNHYKCMDDTHTYIYIYIYILYIYYIHIYIYIPSPNGRFMFMIGFPTLFPTTRMLHKVLEDSKTCLDFRCPRHSHWRSFGSAFGPEDVVREMWFLFLLWLLWLWLCLWLWWLLLWLLLLLLSRMYLTMTRTPLPVVSNWCVSRFDFDNKATRIDK